MNAWKLLAGLLSTLVLQAYADTAPVVDRDYYSLQIASSTDGEAMKRLYQRYNKLPYLRLERRGTLHVLLAGFWDNTRDARAALAQARITDGQLRVAVLRPQAMVQRNWRDAAQGASSAPQVPTPSDTPLVPVPTAPASPQPTIGGTSNTANEKLRAVDPKDWALAYEIFLGAGDLELAFRVAREAVGKEPTDHAWRRKLAQVAEWTQRPAIAAQQWQFLFTHGDRSKDTVAAVVRLSAQMEDPSIVLQVRQMQAQSATSDVALWREIRELFEELSQSSEGARYFEAQYQRTHQVALLEYAAQLASNAGDDERALNLHLQRSRLAPFSMNAILSAVLQLVRTDRLGAALELMQAHDKDVPADAADYWRTLGQIAWDLGQWDSAQSAYQNVATTPKATATDWSRLVYLARQHSPTQAASLATDAYHRFGSFDQLTLALEIYAGLGNLQAQDRIYASLQGDALQRAQKDTHFLSLRAQYYQRKKLPDRAWADLRSALQQAPEDKDTVLAALWFLIGESRTQELGRFLTHYETAARDPAYWLAYGAANQLLGRPREALRWLSKEIRRTPQDPLVQLNYADALEQVQQVGMAARIRRHAWLQLRQKYPTPDAVPALTATPELQALARLALLDQPGDPALQRVRRLTEKMRAAPTDMVDTETSTLVLGWALAQEHFANARSWMWLRYVRQSRDAAPLWAQSQVALQLDDTATMNRLLRDNSAELPIYNRYDTAYALGHVPQALDIAFQGMTQQESDDALYDRYRQHAPGQSGYLQVRTSQESLGTLDTQGIHWEARLVPSEQLQITLGWARTQMSSNDPDLQTLTNASDQLERVELHWLRSGKSGSLALFQRHELTSYTGLQLKQTIPWGDRLSLDAGLSYRADTDITSPMRVTGYENSVLGTLNYKLGKREYLQATSRLSHYYSQYGDRLGTGSLLDLEAGYRIRTEYPDWRLRATYAAQEFSTNYMDINSDAVTRLPAAFLTSIANGTVDPKTYFIPQNNTTWGLCVTMGENLAGQNLQTDYTRAWRAFLDVCVSDNSASGSGYTSTLGFAGSWTGQDHVSIEVKNSDGLTSTVGPTRTLNFQYRHYF